MRQVGEAELVWVICMALRQTGSGIYRQLQSSDRSKAAQAQAMLAGQIADGLVRFEILTSAPAPQNESTFAVPVARMLGEALPSGLPPAGGAPGREPG